MQAASTAATGAGAEAWTPFDLSFDLEFTEGAVLDSIFAGEGYVVLTQRLCRQFKPRPELRPEVHSNGYVQNYHRVLPGL